MGIRLPLRVPRLNTHLTQEFLFFASNRASKTDFRRTIGSSASGYLGNRNYPRNPSTGVARRFGQPSMGQSWQFSKKTSLSNAMPDTVLFGIIRKLSV